MNNAQVNQIVELHDTCSAEMLKTQSAKTRAERKAAQDAYVRASMELNKIHFKKLFPDEELDNRKLACSPPLRVLENCPF